MKDYLKYDGIAVLAHRGGALESYENTLESFDYSIGLGCKYIETDVQLSSCLLYTSPSPRDGLLSRMPSSA